MLCCCSVEQLRLPVEEEELAAAHEAARGAALGKFERERFGGQLGALREALEAAGLGALAGRLDEEDTWDRRLSGGEQQRLALARALLLKPRFLFLDEATASLDPEAEEMLYRRLRERLPGSAIISIAHRPAVARLHDRTLRLEGGRLVAA